MKVLKVSEEEKKAVLKSLGLDGKELSDDEIIEQILKEALECHTTIDDAIKEQETAEKEDKELFDLLDSTYKEVFKNRIEAISYINGNKRRLYFAKAALALLKPDDLEIINKMLEILNKCKETVVKEKELLDIVGVSIERIRQHGLTEYCIELGNLLICIQNRYLLIMTNLDKQLQCYTSALNGCPYTISIDTEEQEKNDKKIDEIRLRLGI